MAERSLAVVQPMTVDLFTDNRVALIRDKFANGAPEDEFSIFMEFCRTRQLDPLQKQVYFIKRQGQWTIQPSIDGYRAIADRTGDFAGQDEITYVDASTNLTNGKPYPLKATCTVYRFVQGVRCPWTRTVRWEEYNTGLNNWLSMPYTMLGKVAESHALRAAFPAQLGGVYTPEEMEQADRDGPVITIAPGRTVDRETGEIIESPAQRKKPDPERAMGHYMAACSDAGLTDAASKLLALVCHPTRPDGPTTSRKQLSAQELDDLATSVKEWMPEPNPLTDYANGIAASPDQKALAKLAGKLKDDGISELWLKAMWRAKNLQAPAAVEVEADPEQPTLDVIEGSAGADRFTS